MQMNPWSEKNEEKGLEKLDVKICVYRLTNLSTMAAAAQATYRDAKKTIILSHWDAGFRIICCLGQWVSDWKEIERLLE
jgi:hypothetical protein